jgi:hypothetical protein
MTDLKVAIAKLLHDTRAVEQSTVSLTSAFQMAHSHFLNAVMNGGLDVQYTSNTTGSTTVYTRGINTVTMVFDNDLVTIRSLQYRIEECLLGAIIISQGN